jgi:lipopolysaccharide/colanic/teichoic acid biosynthesis glycosyltransferase
MNHDLSIKLPDSPRADPATETFGSLHVTPNGAQVARIGIVTNNPSEQSAAPPTRNRSARAPAGEVLSRHEFLQQFQREKRRADRSKAPFATTIFEFAAGIFGEDETADRLMNILCTNKRDTDFVGILDDKRVAVLLTDTDAGGARQFIQKVRQRTEFFALSTVVETYPGRLFDALAGQEKSAAHPVAPFALEAPTRSRKAGYWLKRSIDFIVAAGTLIVISPLMLAVAIAIALDSPGPAIFRQIRIGRGGRPFDFYKFRSMYVGADERVHQEYVRRLITSTEQRGAQEAKPLAWSKLDSDSRITSIGHFLRKTCIDELPQLFNVLKGDLSLVGPRPPLPYEVTAYQSWHLRRVLEATPGITGLWQVNGGNATFDEMVRMDLRYVHSWSLMLDLKILLKTVWIVLRKNGGG